MVGAVVTRLYITLYILAMDICAIAKYKDKNYEYRYVTTKPYIVQWSYAPLIFELFVCFFVVLFIIVTSILIARLTQIESKCKQVASRFKRVAPWCKRVTSPCKQCRQYTLTIVCSSILILPIAFVSAHINYIFAAWLTEPSKTTSIAIMALTIILFLFVMHRTFYKFFAYLFTEWF